MRSLLLCLALSGCWFGGSSGPPKPVPAPSPPPAPTQPLAVLGLGTHSMEAVARAELKALGVRHVRHTLYADLWAEHPTYALSWASLAGLMESDGFQMLVVVHPVPEGWNPERFAGLMGELARVFPAVEAWQVGNEDEFGGSVASHAEYHRAAYAAIKAADPDALVISMAWGEEASVRAFVATGAPFDALAVHAYGYPVSASIRALAPLARDYPVWLTEFGYQPAQAPPGWTGDWEAEQRRQWEAAVRGAGASGFQRGYGYQMRTQEPRELLGIIRPDGTWRPAATWLRSVLK